MLILILRQKHTANSYMMALYKFPPKKVQVLSGTVSQTALSFKPKDRFEEELTFLPL